MVFAGVGVTTILGSDSEEGHENNAFIRGRFGGPP